ncbi:MAG: hypothetical protein HY808_10305 [Nitrospirae bacterium]|nr:hypothetical protein [Nitrospirota bacterium]
MPRKSEQYKTSKNFWITTGVFSSHYLLERLPQAGPKLWPSDEEVSSLKGFLKWLEREIGTAIDELTNKTAIKEYHEHDFNQFLDVLKRNKNKLSIDPSDRKKQELLEKHFTISMSRLEPLKKRIAETDNLIDEIVFRLYGLTDEEIKIVKGGSVDG